MNAVLILVNILLALVAIVLIVSVLAQEGTRQGLGAITGGAETFFGKNKAKSIEGKLELITKIGATVFIVLAIVSTLLTSAINKNNTIVVDDAAVVEDHVHTDGEEHVDEEETTGEETEATEFEETAETESTEG